MNRGPWIQTEPTCTQFYSLDPRPEEIHLADIANSLSRTNRYIGHIRPEWYTVAEHSYLVSLLVPPEHARVALMHDATEAFMGDIPRPLKKAIPQIAEFEERIWQALAIRFGLPTQIPAEVTVIDNRILLDERNQLKGPPPAPWFDNGHLDGTLMTPLGIELLCLSPDAARSQFLFRCAELGIK